LRFERDGAPPVRLAYCLNLHPADSLAELVQGVRAITLPLAERVSEPGGGTRPPFGVGLYVPAAVAFELDGPDGERGRAELRELVAIERLDPFTFNAFPYGGFQRLGLKEDVFRPAWAEPERLAYTRAVARLAVELAGPASAGRHLSISTHTGGFATHVATEALRRACAENLARATAELVRLEEQTGWRIVLSLEAEPRANAGDTRELLRWSDDVRRLGEGVLASELGLDAEAAQAAFERHLGTCLDTCHAAVEFEEPDEAVARSAERGALGKVQFTSALSVARPAEHPDARARLVELAEPVYLHQVTGVGAGGRLQASDLPELAALLRDGGAPWLGCDEWRCHFHVPVDLTLGDPSSTAPPGLGTTRAHADRTLAAALAEPARWSTPELHVELETYTWNVLPSEARGAGDLVGGLEREYAHVTALLARHGWRPTPGSDDPDR